MSLTDNILNWYNAYAYNLIPRIRVRNLFEIVILTLIIYYCINSVKGTRVWIIAKGIIIALGLYFVAYILSFNVIVEVFRSALLFFIAAVVVAIQPELRKFIEKIGNNSINKSIAYYIKYWLSSKKKVTIVQKISDNTINEIAKGCFKMGKVKTGALIAIEGDIPLNEYIESGIQVNADITGALLINIFEKNTPLHDGAVIIRKDKIEAATCYLPLTQNTNINKDLGTRHRAAIGLTEVTDAIVIIVSEETGFVSIAKNGEIKHNIDRETLVEELRNYKLKYENKKIKIKSKRLTQNIPIIVLSLLASLIMWVMVSNSYNPIESITLKGVQIDVINEEAIYDIGKTYKILGETTVDVKITDRKDVIDNISYNDIQVIADMSKLSITNSIPLEVNIDRYSTAECKLSESTIQISIEDLATTEIGISVETVGDNSNYFISEIRLNPDTVVVTGADSVVQTIGSASVTLDKSKLTENYKEKLSIEIYDKNGNIITDKVNVNNSDVEITAILYNTKSVLLDINTNIEDPIIEGLVKEIYSEHDEIIIAGPDDIIDSIDVLNINVDINTTFDEIANTTLIKNISIQQYLPEGVYVGADYKTERLTIELDEYYTKELDITESNIDITGIKDGVQIISISLTDNKIKLLSTSSNLADVTLENVIPYLDLSGSKNENGRYQLKYRNYSDYVINVIEVEVELVKE